MKRVIVLAAAGSLVTAALVATYVLAFPSVESRLAQSCSKTAEMLFFGAIGGAPDFEARFSTAAKADPDGAIFRDISPSTVTYSLAAKAFDRARQSMLLTFFPTDIDLNTQFITSAFDDRGDTYNRASASIVESTIEKRFLLGLEQATYVAQGSISARSTFRPQTIEGMMALSELQKRGVMESPTIQFMASAMCVSTFSETDEPRSALLLTDWDAEAVGCEDRNCRPWTEIMASSDTTADTGADGLLPPADRVE